MICSYCDEPATTNVLVRIGSTPADPKKLGTQSDTSRLETIRMCALHRVSLIDPLLKRRVR